MTDRTTDSQQKFEYDFQFQRFSLLNQKASFVLGFGSLVIAVFFGILDFSIKTPIPVVVLLLIVTGVAAFLLADVLSIFIILPRHLKADFDDEKSMAESIKDVESQNDYFAQILRIALLIMLYGVVAISFSLFSLLFADQVFAYIGWPVAIFSVIVSFIISQKPIRNIEALPHQ